MSLFNAQIGRGFKIGDRVLIAGEPFFWAITGVRLNVKRGKLVELSRQTDWIGYKDPITITTAVPLARVEKANHSNRGDRRRRR